MSAGMEDQPFPLEALIPLLTHALYSSDPRFHNLHLYDSSHASTNLVTRFMAHDMFKSDFDDEPHSISTRDLHIYKSHDFNVVSLYAFEPTTHPDIVLPNYLVPHPDAPNLDTLCPQALYLIYMQTRSHNACFKAAYLFSRIISFFPYEQIYSIGSSCTLGWEAWQLFEPRPIQFRLRDPIHHTIVGKTSCPYTMITGSRNLEWHCVIGILLVLFYPNPKGKAVTLKSLDEFLILDMTRMQYGMNALIKNGAEEKTYFLGSWTDYVKSMEGICGEIVDIEILDPKMQGEQSSALKERLGRCAANVYMQWMGRDVNGWCMACGGSREDGGAGGGWCHVHRDGKIQG